MFSSFTALFPSPFPAPSAPVHAPPPPDVVVDNIDALPPLTLRIDPDIVVAKDHSKHRDREKLANETFIIVRPPPAKSNHPLNLQVQLVPPNTRAPSGVVPRASSESTRTTPSLARSPSDASASSYSTSTASFASFNSSVSNGTNRRTIIPLYNLQAHNVLPNVVVDAGTDAKIARFQKRGIELVELAFLEPVEVWGAKGAGDMAALGGAILRSPGRQKRASLIGTFLHPINASAGSSAVSVSSTAPSHSIPNPLPSPMLPPPVVARSAAHLGRASAMGPRPPTAPESPKRNLFGKLFGKRTRDAKVDVDGLIGSEETSGKSRLAHLISRPNKPPDSSSDRESRESLDDRNAREWDFDRVRPQPPMSPTQITVEVIRTHAQQLQLRPPVLGIQPTFVSATGSEDADKSLDKERALMYVWLVRRWLKKPANEGSFGSRGLPSMLRVQKGSREDLTIAGVEVRFEWKSARAKSRKKGVRGRSAKVHEERSEMFGGRVRNEHRSHSPNSQERETDIGSAEGDTIDDESGTTHAQSDMYDSDPEDSETPWVCTLKIRRTNPAVPSTTPLVVRIKVGTLSPTPHHPKVVAMLKIPFPLPDIEVEHMGVRRRVPGSSGNPVDGTTPTSGNLGYGYEGTTLMAEEIKDIVCSTGLWLVVREGFGGVGRVNRKGDGWRIRA